MKCSVISPWAPLVWRFMKDEYIEAFLERGELRLSSFKKCRTGEEIDESRRDPNEGRITLSSGNNALDIETCNDALVLCFSLTPYAHNPHDYKKCLIIQNLYQLIKNVTEALEEKGLKVIAVSHGPCCYSERWFGFSSCEYVSNETKYNTAKAMADKIWYVKDAAYRKEYEYRCIWCLSQKIPDDHIDIVVPRPYSYADMIDISAIKGDELDLSKEKRL